MRSNLLIICTAVLQVSCAGFFVADLVLSLFGLRAIPLSWQMRESLEIGAAAGLVIGAFLALWSVRQSHLSRRRSEEQIKLLSGAFAEVIEQYFQRWKLSPAERDVALYIIKGYNTQEIAQSRDKREGTIKSQTNAIYRKAGVTSRHALLSIFIEDLLQTLPHSPAVISEAQAQ